MANIQIDENGVVTVTQTKDVAAKVTIQSAVACFDVMLRDRVIMVDGVKIERRADGHLTVNDRMAW